MKMIRQEDGTFPRYAFPGGYPLLYHCQDGGTLCSACANQENGSEATDEISDPMWRLIGYDVFYEGHPVQCDHCGTMIESAYGPVAGN